MPSRSSRVERRGYALVFALWIALLVGFAGAVATRLAAAGAGASRVEADLARARAAAEGGVWAAVHRLAVQSAASRAPQAEFTFVLGGSEVAVSMVDEDGRVDLNAAPERLLAELFEASGISRLRAASLARQVAEWRDPTKPRSRDEAGRRGGEGETAASRAAFRTASELKEAVGSNGALPSILSGTVTVHTGRAQPAGDSAPPLVVAALQRLADPSNTPVRPGTGLRTPSWTRGSTAGRRTIWRIEARARHGATEAQIVAVLELARSNGSPGRLLEWRPSGL